MRHEWVGGRSGRENTNLTSHGETVTDVPKFDNVHICRFTESELMVVHESHSLAEGVITNRLRFKMWYPYDTF